MYFLCPYQRLFEIKVFTPLSAVIFLWSKKIPADPHFPQQEETVEMVGGPVSRLTSCLAPDGQPSLGLAEDCPRMGRSREGP